MLDAPEPKYASAGTAESAVPRRTVAPDRVLRRDYTDAYGSGEGDEAEGGSGRRRSGIRVSFDGGVLPRSMWGRIAAGAGGLLALGLAVGAIVLVHGYLLRDEHFTVANSSAIQIEGNAHLTRPQLLSVFGEDVERNIFRIPLAQRRADLESLPWVGHATVMRLLPNRVRVSVMERTPVAYVRQGRKIGLVDAHGVLLDVAAPEPDDAEGARPAEVHYSFPVLTGVTAREPVSTRAARMKIYMVFVAALDASGEKISSRLSEVDLSNPEDVKALIPDRTVDILVHFGSERFLERYRKYEEHLAEWKTQYPKLASVDMRYERQVVLEMQAGSAVPSGAPAVGADAGAAAAEPVVKPAKLKGAAPSAVDARTKKAAADVRVSAAVLKARAMAKSANAPASGDVR